MSQAPPRVPAPLIPPSDGTPPPVTGTIQTQTTLLDGIALFQPLPAQLKQQLQAQLTRRSLKSGEVLFNAGDVGDAMYLIHSGMVSVYLSDRNLGLTYELAKLGAGQAFGEMALVTGEPRSASVRAIDDANLLQLSRDVFFKLVNAAPQVALTIAQVLAKRLDQHNKAQGIEFGALRDIKFDPAALELIPAPLIKRHRMVPVAVAGGIVTVATPDPGNRLGVDDLRRLLRGMEIKLLAVSAADFDAFVTKHVATAAERPVAAVSRGDFTQLARQIVYQGSPGSERDDSARLKQVASGQDVVDLLSAILAEGIERGASDIHLEPDRNRLVVRYRIDGRLSFRDGTIPSSVHLPLMSRLKILASLDIAEKRLPQDGRISLDMGPKSYDLRMATVNTKYGEKATLRILDSSQLEQNLASLVLADKVSQVVRKLFYRPNGLVLVTGPTGSGKTTTLYAALKERHNPELSICTIEDPIEYDVPGITQVQVNDGINLGFAEVMRTFLRQDPDVILVGETRDATTAKLACNAALTGHLVLSSFHTNDAISALMRLREMEIEPFVLAGALLGVINQRLVRRICPNCRVESSYSEVIKQNLARAGVALETSAKLYKGAGCQACNGEGYKGRIGVFELLVVSANVREAIAQEGSTAAIQLAAQDGSFVSLARYSTFLLQEGLTVPSEVLRILPKE
ncbi:MAG: ATPase, T2SS/T4P/T4SS family [Pseudomonadota bacterium]